MKIGIDIMGGDFAPNTTIEGSILAKPFLDDTDKLVLFGKEKVIIEELGKRNCNPSDFEIVNCEQTIEMGENPAKAYSSKPNSSIAKGISYLKNNEINGFASAGSTGAIMVGVMHVIKSIPGVIRPSIAVAMPKINGGVNIILDVGINPDCRPDVLYQYGVLGSLYAKNVFEIKVPRIGLLNIGSEENKGNLLTKSAFELMKDSVDFHFIGNIEANEIFNNNKVDVIVCDGFVGNVILKEAEAFYHIAESRNISDEYINKLNFEQYGGIPVLGINSVIMIGHGISNSNTIKQLILQTKHIINSKLTEKIKDAFN